MRTIHDEDPFIHWENVNVEGKRVLDLGCGDFGNAGNLPYVTTLEYFLLKNASYVIGIDGNANDYNYVKALEAKYNNFDVVNEFINSPNHIEDLINLHKIDVIKSDIEGAEIHLLELPDDIFSMIEEYYIETHSEFLHTSTLEKLNRCGYVIYDEVNLGHTGGTSKVIFAKK